MASVTSESLTTTAAVGDRIRGLVAAIHRMGEERSVAGRLGRMVELAADSTGALHAGFVVDPGSWLGAACIIDATDSRAAAATRAALEAHGVTDSVRAGLAQQRPASPVVGSAGHAVSGGVGNGAWLEVGMRTTSGVTGRLYLLGRVDGGAFSVIDREVAAGLVQITGLGVDNIGQLEEAKLRQEWFRGSSEISQRLVASFEDERAVWQAIARWVNWLGAAQTVTIAAPVPGRPGWLQVAVAAGAGANELVGQEYPVEGSPAARAMETGCGELMAAHQLYRVHADTPSPVQVGQVIAIPLKAGTMAGVGQGVCRGVMVVSRHVDQPPFREVDLQMSEDFAARAALALDLAEARQAQTRLDALEDRERIGYDLHDHVIQQLFAAGLSLQSTITTITETGTRDRLTSVVDSLDTAIRQVRATIFNLRQHHHPPEAATVHTVVAATLDNVSPLLGFDPELHCRGALNSVTDATTVDDVRAVLRESLTNVARHAHATAVVVHVTHAGDRLTVTVTDNGAGLKATTRRSGLANLQARARRHGGTCTLTEPPAGGLQLTWQIALR